ETDGGDVGDVGSGVGRDEHGLREAHDVRLQACRVAERVDQNRGSDAHREHAMRENARQADALCDVVAVVDRVEVPRGTRVAHEVLAGEVNGLLGENLALFERHHASSDPMRSVELAVTTCSPAASVMTVSLVTIEAVPIARTRVTLSCPVSSSPATMGRV